MKLKVPGNLLLLGEFAVTLEGGLGIACTIESCVTIEVKKSDKLKITSSHGDHLIRFTLERLFPEPPPLEIFVDSTCLFKENGEKMGLGSSAAVVAGLTFAVTQEETFTKALAIHRAFQGGRGSGYDVAVSLLGIGQKPLCALFKGGARPAVELLPPLIEKIQLVSGKSPVSTPKMLVKFEALEDKAAFLNESNEIVLSFLKERDLKKAFIKGKALHETLHRKMGVETSFPELEKLGGIGKPLGSGYELGAFFLESNS